MPKTASKAKSKALPSDRATLSHDYLPMELQPVKEIPTADDSNEGWLYEPKWDGFRCLAFCEEGEIDLRSKKGQPLARYFPEVVEALKALGVANFVLDGELMIWQDKVPSFDKLLHRIHPAETRIRKLSKETPATYVVFDLLAEPGKQQQQQQQQQYKNISEQPLSYRREHLEQFAAKHFAKDSSIVLSPATREVKAARKWYDSKGTELDGVVAKHLDMPYQSGNRTGAVKIKRAHTVDCVIGGFRYGAHSKDVGSLLLGLYDQDGELHHVGFTSAMSASEKKRLTKLLEPLERKKSFTVNVPGGPSRWNNGEKAPWTPLKPELVVEVQYDHFTDGRFRHGTKILRWRPDKAAKQCNFEQIGG